MLNLTEEGVDEEETAIAGNLPRPFKFLELFAGMGGMSLAIRDVCGGMVEVLEPQDLYHQWDILSPQGFAMAEEWVDKADHVHLAFPCRSFTRSRRTDQHAIVLVVRNDRFPEGWGHPISEEGNQILNPVGKLTFKAVERRKTVSLENPLNAYSWDMKVMKQMGTAMQEEPFPLDQWSRDEEADQHPDGCAVDERGEPQMPPGSASSSSRRRTHWLRLGPNNGRLGVANFASSGVPTRTMSGLGMGASKMAGRWKRQRMAGFQNYGQGGALRQCLGQCGHPSSEEAEAPGPYAPGSRGQQEQDRVKSRTSRKRKRRGSWGLARPTSGRCEKQEPPESWFQNSGVSGPASQW